MAADPLEQPYIVKQPDLEEVAEAEKETDGTLISPGLVVFDFPEGITPETLDAIHAYYERAKIEASDCTLSDN